MGGVFKTEDGSESWSRIGDGTYLLMDHQDSSHLYVRDENGIYETTDQGNNWKTVYDLKKDCPGTILSWAVHPTDSKMLFFGSEDECGAGVYQSNDSGHTWKLIGETGGWDNLNVLAVGLDEQGNYSIYNKNGITHDGGVTWYYTEAFGCNTLTSDPDDPATIYCAYGQGGLMSIHGKGSTWQRIGLGTSKITAIHVDYINGTRRIITGGARLKGRTEDGIFISNDSGASWNQRGGGLGSTWSELKIDPMDNSRIYLASYYGRETTSWNACSLYRSQDKGKNWSSLIDLDEINVWCGPAIDGNSVLYLMRQNALDKSWDHGDNWLWITSDTSKWTQYFLPTESQSVSANPYIDRLIYAVGDDIYYSTDEGQSWLPGTGSKDLWDARLFYKDQGQSIYAIGRYHQSYSTDSGKTWQSCGEDVTASHSDTRLALDLQSSRLYLATPGQGILISTDECHSWQASNEGLGNLFVNTLAIDPNKPEIIYAGTDGGAYISFDSGQTWRQVNNGLLGATVVYSIAVDPESNVYAATPYGIFKLEGK